MENKEESKPKVEYRNPKALANGDIDCEINHPTYGWIPFTAKAGDRAVELFDVDALHSEMANDSNLIPAPTKEVEAAKRLDSWRKTVTMSRVDFCLAVKRAGIISAQEAKIAAAGGIPQVLESALVTLPQDQADEIEITWAGTSHVSRNHAVIALLRDNIGLNDSQLDELFGWKQ